MAQVDSKLVSSIADTSYGAKIISLNSFERLCRKQLLQWPHASMLSILIIVQLSTVINVEWSAYNTLYKTIGSGRGRTPYLGAAVCEFFTKNGIDAQKFPRVDGRIEWRIRINEDFIDFELVTSIDGQIMSEIFSILKTFTKKHSDISPIAGLVLIAVYVRRLRSLSDIEKFVFKCERTNNSSLYRIINALEESGHIQSISDLNNKRLGKHIFPVNDI